jgi:AraC family transcriptional regulator, regulatory protein of adaptative response / DNA-3-methyladenine glycosylase II
VLRALRQLAAAGADPGAERWRPWRSYATHHLWATLESAPPPRAGARDDDLAFSK